MQEIQVLRLRWKWKQLRGQEAVQESLHGTVHLRGENALSNLSFRVFFFSNEEADWWPYWNTTTRVFNQLTNYNYETIKIILCALLSCSDLAYWYYHSSCVFQWGIDGKVNDKRSHCLWHLFENTYERRQFFKHEKLIMHIQQTAVCMNRRGNKVEENRLWDLQVRRNKKGKNINRKLVLYTDFSLDDYERK